MAFSDRSDGRPVRFCICLAPARFQCELTAYRQIHIEIGRRPRPEGTLASRIEDLQSKFEMGAKQILLLVRIQSPGGQKAGGAFRIPEVWAVRIPAGDNGDGCIRGRRILPGIRNGKHPVPVKGSCCKEKCMILRRTDRESGVGNPDQPARKLRFPKKTVCPAKR